MQRNLYNFTQEFLVIAFVLKNGQKCSVVSIVVISTRNVVHLPFASGRLRQLLTFTMFTNSQAKSYSFQFCNFHVHDQRYNVKKVRCPYNVDDFRH